MGTEVIKSARTQASDSVRSGGSSHFVLDGFLPEPLLRSAAAQIHEGKGDENGCLPDADICSHDLTHDGGFVKEYGKNMYVNEWLMPDAVQQLLSLLRSAGWIRMLQDVLRVSGLIPDPHVLGSGIMNVVQGGYLRLHLDYNWVPSTRLYRRAAVFVYLNEDWEEQFGGALEVWNRFLTRCTLQTLPVFGRVVGLLLDDFTYHGHPHPLRVPVGRSRRSIGLYYYTTSRPASECRQGNCELARQTTWAEVDCRRCHGSCCKESCSRNSSMR